jgi:hypothetical protein
LQSFSTRAVLAVLGLVSLPVLAATPAAAVHVQCGHVLVEDTTLDSDLTDCPGDGLVIGSDGVALDIAGHTIDGLGATEDQTGIKSNGFREVTVRDGVVQDFGTGVALRPTASSVVRNITTRSQYPLAIGIAVVGDRNLVERNTTTNGGGALGVHGDANRVARNLIASGTDDDWFLVSGSNSEIVRNEVRLGDPTVCRAFRFSLNDSLVARNTLTGTGAFPVADGECFGFLGSGDGTTLDRNSVTGLSTGISVSGDLLLTRNVANANAWNGLEAAPSVTLTRNTANDNGNLGIEAPGAIDGGGNRARGNGNPAQCVGVSCR